MYMPVDADVSLAQVLEQIVRIVRQLSTVGQLSLSAAATLTRIAADGPQRLTDLAAWERQSQPGMTQLATRLERDGLVAEGRRRPTNGSCSSGPRPEGAI
jgi:hypothetical protein